MSGLEEVLRELAQVVPERIRCEVASDASYFACAGLGPDAPWWSLGYVFEGQHEGYTQFDLLVLRASLEEEIEARGWSWMGGRSMASKPAQASVVIGADDPVNLVQGDTPAEALALALLTALVPAAVQVQPKAEAGR